MTLRVAAILCTLAPVLCIAPQTPAAETPPPRHERAEMWTDLYTGEPVSFAEVTADLLRADHIFIGESHTVDRHHDWQRRIVAALAEGEPRLVLGLEMMEKRNQPALDRYAAGTISFDELAEATEWRKQWSNYEDYRAVLETARAVGAKILGLNADAGVIRKIGREGLDALSPEERGSLPPDLQLDDPPYFALLKMRLMVHASVTEDNLRRIFAAQVARDENMAETLAEYVQSREGRGRRAVVLCGGGHCAYGYGTASRLARRIPDAKARIVLLSDSGDTVLPEAMRKHVRAIEITHQQLRDAINQPLADYLSVIEPAP